jgi:hypothetical protein
MKCDKEFQSELLLEDHANIHTDEVLNAFKDSGFRRIGPQVQSEAQKSCRKFECGRCDKVFETQSALDTHLKSHSEYKCM